MKGLIFPMQPGCGDCSGTQTVTIKCNLAGIGIQDEWQRTVGAVDEFH